MRFALNVNNADVDYIQGKVRACITRREELLNKLHYFSFLCSQKYYCSFPSFEVGPLMFYRCSYYVSGPGDISVALLSMQGQRALRFNQKHLNLCSEDEQRSYGFGTTRGWVIIDRIFILGWTNPLTTFFSIVSFRNSPTNNLLFPMTSGVTSLFWPHNLAEDRSKDQCELLKR